MIHEACVILNAQLTEEETTTQVEKLKQMLVSSGAEVLQVALWGRRKLAYEINKASEGYYVVIFFKLAKGGAALANFSRSCGYDDNVLRVMIIKSPEKLKKTEIKPLVPGPGYLADFSMKLRAMPPRRRSYYGDGPPRSSDAPAAVAEGGEGGDEAEPETEA